MKTKKFISFILTIAMAMSVVVFTAAPVFAEGPTVDFFSVGDVLINESDFGTNHELKVYGTQQNSREVRATTSNALSDESIWELSVTTNASAEMESINLKFLTDCAIATWTTYSSLDERTYPICIENNTGAKLNIEIVNDAEVVLSNTSNEDWMQYGIKSDSVDGSNDISIHMGDNSVLQIGETVETDLKDPANYSYQTGLYSSGNICLEGSSESKIVLYNSEIGISSGHGNITIAACTVDVHAFESGICAENITLSACTMDLVCYVTNTGADVIDARNTLSINNTTLTARAIYEEGALEGIALIAPQCIYINSSNLYLTGSPSAVRSIYPIVCVEEEIAGTTEFDSTDSLSSAYALTIQEGEDPYLHDVSYFFTVTPADPDKIAKTVICTAPLPETPPEMPPEPPVYYVPTYYNVSASSEIRHGSIKANCRSAYAGMTVTVTADPDQSWLEAIVSVKAVNGKEIKVNKKAQNKYSFRMPACDVTIDATFDVISSVSDCPCDETCAIEKYADTENNCWWHNGIHYCVENGWMLGIGDENFAPEENMSRAMIATILWRIAGMPYVDYAMTFEDVQPDQWYTEAVRWAQAERIITGYDDQTFGTNDPVTKEQILTIFCRYFESLDIEAISEYRLDEYFSDVDEVSDWAMTAVSWAFDVCLFPDDGGDLLNPKADCSRGEGACIVQRFCEMLEFFDIPEYEN